MTSQRKCTATKALLALLLWCSASLALAAQVAGTVVQLSGPLLAKKASGVVKILSLKSEVESGDTLVTEKNTYAMVRFVDASEITLKPGTTLTVENFSFDGARPEGDAANFNLVKGGLRSITGLLGKRSKEKFALKTPTATIGIRGTTFIADYVPGGETEEQALASARAWVAASTAALDGGAPLAPLMLAQAAVPRPPAGGLAPGLYVQVIDGLISLSNRGGTSNFSAGQFGFTPSFKQPPVVLPSSSQVPAFSLPIKFNVSSASQDSSAGSGKSGSVDCEVR